MRDPALTLVAIGGCMLLGLVTDVLGRRTPLPRARLLLVPGVLVGPTGFDALPPQVGSWFPIVADGALQRAGDARTAGGLP